MKYPELILEQMEIGPMNNFIYFIGDKASGEIAVIDPAWDVAYLRNHAKEKGYKITNIFLTHGHKDHVNGIDELQTTHDVSVYISEHEAPFYTPKCKNLKKVADRAVLKVGALELECLHTPGHTPGCQCFKYKDILIAGDTLFIDGCGRVDLPGGSAETLFKSLQNVILKLPDTTVIYPGHNYGDVAFETLGEQKKTNPYLQSGNLESFLKDRM
ncbi:MAG: MBL fold metallo-hydrolase [Candidatus Omnitrophica bacterium]|nr:MBL fold metallo-hydrolase [Candidatus Omnitrophota bacterium]